MPDDRFTAMSEEWIIRVEGKEYGPADPAVLDEWRREGRVLAANDARRADLDVWITAAEIPGLFESVPPPASLPEPAPSVATNGSLWGDTFRIYAKGLPQFLCLSLLVIVPSICSQLTSVAVETSANADLDFRALLAGGFAFCMLLLSLALWPIYVAGIQILSAELAVGRRIGFFELLNRAVKFWPRMALLCLFVYGTYFFWTVLLLGLIVMIISGGPSLMFIFVALLLLAFWVWIIGRLFVNFLFWPQFAVLDGLEVANTLRRSKELARSGGNLPWYQRPLWRGIFIASAWFAFVFALGIGPAWPMVRAYFHEIAVTQNPETLMQTLKAASAARGFDLLGFALGIWQGLMRPLLGIAFVLLYFDSRNQQ
jgi:hypothetical protein